MQTEEPRFVDYTKEEEIGNSITHGIGAVLSIAALILMTITAAKTGDPWRIGSAIVFGISLVMLYSMSTLYHAFAHPGIKKFFMIMDHISIYLLIAGTYTPFVLVTLRQNNGWVIFTVVWSLAALGTILSLFHTDRLRILYVLLYLGMGWIVVFSFDSISMLLQPQGVSLLIAGGITYSAGIIFYMWKKLPYSHVIWHLFVLGGSICHYLAIQMYVLPNTM